MNLNGLLARVVAEMYSPLLFGSASAPYSALAAMNWRIMRLALIALPLALLLSSAPAQGQTNPALQTCGLPAGGDIRATVTYTLSADCELNQPLIVDVQQPNASVTLTIDGGGYTISPSSSFAALHGFGGFIRALSSGVRIATVVLRNVTLDADGRSMNPALRAEHLTAVNVTFQGNNSGIWGAITSGMTWSLTNVLFRDNSGSLAGDPATLLVRDGGSLTMNNVAFEKNLAGSAALKFESGSTVNTSGCLSDAANIPRLVEGRFSHNLQPCTGNIGNSDTLDTATAAAQACGFPAAGEVREDAEYTLTADCDMTGDLYITEGVTVTVTVNGDPKAIRGPTGGAIIWVGHGSTLNLNNIVLHNVRINNWGHIKAEILAVRDLDQRFLLNLGTADFNRLLLDDLNFSAANSYAIVSLYYLGKGVTKIREGIFRDIVNGDGSIPRATLWAVGPSARITLTGCAAFIRNSPPETTLEQGGGVVSDRRTRDCPESLIENFHTAPLTYDSLPTTPTPKPAPTPTPTPRPCPSPPEGGRYGAIGSGQWQGHYARLGIQAQSNQAAWARGDAGVRGANTCFWDYDCSTNAHWAYGSYHATHGHVILAPGSSPPLAVGRGGGKYNLCFSVWENSCNSTEAWEFGHASGKQIYDEWFYQRETAARSDC